MQAIDNMQHLVFLTTLFLASSSAPITDRKCPFQFDGIRCACGKFIYSGEYLRCSLKNLTQLRLLSDYINERNVSYLSLVFDAIETFPSSIIPFHKFIEIVINGKDLVAVEENAFVGVEKSLKNLRLRNGRFQKIPFSAIKRLKGLRHLDMEGNQFTTLDHPLCTLTLVGLNLNRNQISSVEKGSLPDTLEDLGLSRNNLHSLNGALSRNIVDLDISYNYITSLDGEFEGVPKLKRLNACCNGIRGTGDKAFENVPKLTSLDLSNNSITSVEECFKGLHSLGYLDLSTNDLSHVSATAFSDLQQLRKLNISFNKLQCLPEGTMGRLKSLVELDISANKLLNLAFLLHADGEGQTTFGKDIGVTRLKHLWMKDSGIKCEGTNKNIIANLLEKNKDLIIEGNPCPNEG